MNKIDGNTLNEKKVTRGQLWVFNRFFKKVEQVNNHEATLSELNEELYVESPIEEANSYWVSMAQNIIINAVKAADNNVERAFVLLNLKKVKLHLIFSIK